MEQPTPKRQAVIQNALKQAANKLTFFKSQMLLWTLDDLRYAEERVELDVDRHSIPEVRLELARGRAELLEADRDRTNEERNAARHGDAMHLGRETLKWAKIAGWAAVVSVILAIIAIVVAVWVAP